MRARALTTNALGLLAVVLHFAVDATAQTPCGCEVQGAKFCNFDGASGDSGSCEPCADYSDANDCGSNGLPPKGAADCKARCFSAGGGPNHPSPRPTAAVLSPKCGCEIKGSKFCSYSTDDANSNKGSCTSCGPYISANSCDIDGQPPKTKADCQTWCLGAPRAVCRHPTCDSVKDAASFCKSNGANGLVANPGSVKCQATWSWKPVPCNKHDDAHTCCRAPTNCKLHNGMGDVSYNGLASVYGADYTGADDFKQSYLIARAHLSTFATKVSLSANGENDQPEMIAATKFDDRGICAVAMDRVDKGLNACGLTHNGVTLLCSGTYYANGDSNQLHQFNDSSAAAVLATCVTPCMKNLNNRCCSVPKPVCCFLGRKGGGGSEEGGSARTTAVGRSALPQRC